MYVSLLNTKVIVSIVSYEMLSKRDLIQYVFYGQLLQYPSIVTTIIVFRSLTQKNLGAFFTVINDKRSQSTIIIH